MVDYLITTRIEDIPTDRQIIMIDGTVPHWTPKPGDYHFDHHRPGGAPTQIEELPTGIRIEPDAIIVSTQIDADACVAGAYLQLPPIESLTALRKLTAIASDCDHLSVPEGLSDLADFAAQAVAAMKAVSHIGKATTPEEKRILASIDFRSGVEWLIAAVNKERPWPGEMGEALEYWQKVEADTRSILDRNLIELTQGFYVFNELEFKGRYVDPRSWIKALPRLTFVPKYPITLTAKYRNGGTMYILGTIPFHPDKHKYNYHHFYAALSQAEQRKNPTHDGWNGRETVGGSSWNHPSNLSVTDVLSIILNCLTILKTPGVCGGVARIGNTRIPVWTIISFLRMGASWKELFQNYPSLPADGIDNALRYYEYNKAEINQAIKANE